MNKNKALRVGGSRCLQVAALAAVLAGCATTEMVSHDPRDPWEDWNRSVQSFNDELDDYVMKPMAEGYQWIAPAFVDQGVTNFFSNVDDIAVTLNDLLQQKFEQSGMDAGRFLVNTTAGVIGFVDVASMLDLPKHNEDFDQTLGTWGVPTGPYVILPFLGPSTPRGISGLAADSAMNPFSYMGVMPVGSPTAISTGVYGARMIDARADLLSSTKIVDEAALDRYEFIRNAYFQQRNFLVYDGSPPYQEGYEDELDREMEQNLDESEKK